MRNMLTAFLLLATAAGRGLAQDCPPCPPAPPPPPHWIVSVGAGVTRTGGNSDTSSYNVAANVTYDPRKTNVFRGEVLLWKADDFGDAYYRFEAGVGAALAKRLGIEGFVCRRLQDPPRRPGARQERHLADRHATVQTLT